MSDSTALVKNSTNLATPSFTRPTSSKPQRLLQAKMSDPITSTTFVGKNNSNQTTSSTTETISSKDQTPAPRKKPSSPSLLQTAIMCLLFTGLVYVSVLLIAFVAAILFALIIVIHLGLLVKHGLKYYGWWDELKFIFFPGGVPEWD